MLKLTHLCKRFDHITAVDDLSLVIEPGEVFGLLGPNGAGKTTTVNMVVGLLQPDDGQVEIGEHGAPSGAAARAQLGIAPQALALYDELTATENLMFFGRMQRLRGAALRKRVAVSLDFVGLTDRAKDKVGAYSGGMKRRLNLAVAVLHEPALLLLDEPTVGVDPQSRLAVFENIEALKRAGTTIVYTTHYMEEAERLCDRVGIMDQGTLLALDSVDALIAEHGGRSIVRVQRDGTEQRITSDDPIAELNRLQQAGPLDLFSVERPTLETVFLNLTGRQLRD
jgi:ABC-2 type transport system ATP-binding protein